MPDRTSLLVREPDRLRDLLIFVTSLPGGPGQLVVSNRAQGRRCQVAAEVHRPGCPAGSDSEPLHIASTDRFSSVAGGAPTGPQPVTAAPSAVSAPTICSCVLGEVPDPQRFLDDLHELLEFGETLARTGPLSTTLLPGADGLLAARMLARTTRRPLHLGLRHHLDRLLRNTPPSTPGDCTGFVRYAARKVSYDLLLNTIGGQRARQDRLAKVLETWLLDPGAIDDPYRSLDDAFDAVPARPDDAPLRTDSMAALRLGWCGTLKLQHADLDPVVCEIVGAPGSDLGIRGAVATSGARVGAPFTSGARSFGVYPEVVARWLGTPSASRFAADIPGPAVLRLCGPLGCDPTREDWATALVLYDDDGFASFADALTAATLL
jgi:hypothetical protein